MHTTQLSGTRGVTILTKSGRESHFRLAQTKIDKYIQTSTRGNSGWKHVMIDVPIYYNTHIIIL